MCGIAGFFNNKGNDPKLAVAFALMSMEMELRGSQSWGITDGKEVFRKVGRISEGLVIPQPLPENCVIHTRFATHGKVKTKNSHPFRSKGLHDVVGVHNGVIYNHEKLNAIHGRNFAVDSQHIFEHIANDIPLDDLEGYGTIVYRKNDKWYIGTFNNGDLCAKMTDYGILFASTYNAVSYSCGVAGIETNTLKLKDNMIYEVRENGLYEHQPLDIQQTVFKGWESYGGGLNKGYKCGESFASKPTGFDTCLQCGSILSNPSAVLCKDCAAMADGDIDERRDIDNFFEDVMPYGMNFACDECAASIPEFSTVYTDGTEYICEDCYWSYALPRNHADVEFTPEKLDKPQPVDSMSLNKKSVDLVADGVVRDASMADDGGPPLTAGQTLAWGAE